MEPTAAEKKNKKQRLIHGNLTSRHDDLLRTNYPKRCPTYLVAFSLKETYDDLATAQQMICKRPTPEHSPQESINSITPTGSLKILETELSESNITVKNIPSSAEQRPQRSNSITPTGSFRILETELGESNITVKNIPSSPEQRPEHSNSITPTGSLKTLETELGESNIDAKKTPSSPEQRPQECTTSITPTGYFKIIETELDESNKIAKNTPLSPEQRPQECTTSITTAGSTSPEQRPQERTNSITPTGTFKILKPELDESNLIAKNTQSNPERSPYDSTNSITPTGSSKILELDLDNSNIIETSNNDLHRMRKSCPDSITPKNSLKVLETERASDKSQILDIKHSENKPISNYNSVHSSIYSTNSSTPTSSLTFSSSDYSTASRITISEKQKLTYDFTAFGTNSNESSTTEYNNITENTMKCDVVAQNSIRREVDPQEEEEEILRQKEKIEKYITVYVYESDNNSTNKAHTGDSDHMGYTVNTSDSGNTGDTDNKDSDEHVNYVSGEINEGANISQENRKRNKEPESIYKAVRKNRVPKKKRSFRRKSYNAVNIKQKKFKCKFSKKKIDSRLEKYYEKRNNSIDAYQIQLDLYSDEVSTVVSRTQVVHKKARENLLENSDLNTFTSDFEDERSLTSSLSTARKTLMSVSVSSQSTLVQEPSTISNVTDILDMVNINNDIEVDHVRSLLKIPNVNDLYKSEVVSIPVTVAYDRVSGSKNENHLLTSQETSEEIFMLVKLPLTSCEGVMPFISNTVSEINELSSDNFDKVTIKPSSKTLINNSNFVHLSSDDFYNARTSSQFSKCLDSYSTLTNDRNTVINVESTTEDSVLNKEAMIFETVINLDRCDEAPSTSSVDQPYFNDVIVANVPNHKHSNYRNHSENKDNEKENNRKTILSKTTDKPTEKVPNKILNLPNQMEIKALLREKEMPLLKCGDEMRNPPNMPPIWERLMSALEMAVHRLEDNLVDKIMKEIKKSVFKEPEQRPHNSETKTRAEEADCENLSVQCDLVKSTTIDKIMGNLSSEGPKIKKPNTLHKLDLYNDIEVIVSPDTTQALTEKGDQITISTLTSDSHKLHHRLSWLTSVPVSFIRENMLVITSVPTFFVFLLCIYGLIQFVMKPLW